MYDPDPVYFWGNEKIKYEMYRKVKNETIKTLNYKKPLVFFAEMHSKITCFEIVFV